MIKVEEIVKYSKTVSFCKSSSSNHHGINDVLKKKPYKVKKITKSFTLKDD